MHPSSTLLPLENRGALLFDRGTLFAFLAMRPGEDGDAVLLTIAMSFM